MVTPKRPSKIADTHLTHAMRLSWTIATGKNIWKKIVLHPRTTLARPSIYDQALPERLSTISPDNPVGVRKPPLFFFFGQPDTRSLEQSTEAKEIYFLTISSDKTITCFARGRNLHKKALLYRLFKVFFTSKDTHFFEACWTGKKLSGKKLFENSFSCSKTFGQKSVKSKKISAKYCMKLTLPFCRLTIVRIS